MSRRKGVDERKIPHYLKVRGEIGGRFVPLTNALMLDTLFQSLTPNARWFFLALCMEAGGKPTVSMSHSAAKKYGIKPTSYDAAVKQLTERGLIKLVDGLSRLETNRFEFPFVMRGNPPGKSEPE